MVGTWRSSEGTTFAVCHGRRPAVVIDVTGQGYDRLVVTVDNPADVVARLSKTPVCVSLTGSVAGSSVEEDLTRAVL